MIENATFPSKIQRQKPVLKQIEWGGQNGPVINKGVLLLLSFI